MTLSIRNDNGARMGTKAGAIAGAGISGAYFLNSTKKMVCENMLSAAKEKGESVIKSQGESVILMSAFSLIGISIVSALFALVGKAIGKMSDNSSFKKNIAACESLVSNVNFTAPTSDKKLEKTA